MKPRRYTSFVILCLAMFLIAAAVQLPKPEAAGVVKAGDLVPAEMLRSKKYTIDEKVPTEGYLGNFTLHTQFGPLQVRGTDLLKARVSEIPAMEKLDELSKTEVFAKAAAQAAMKPIKSLEKAAEDPVGTVKGVPAGVGRFFKKTAKAVQKGVDSVKDSGDDSSGGSSGDAFKEVAGLNKILRELAKSLRVDPYTTNPILRKQLEGVAKASFAGGLTTRVVVPSVPGVSTVVTVSNLVWDMPPDDLKALNEKKLNALGIPAVTTKAFLDNKNFTPTTQTALVLLLEELKGVPGLDKALTAANASESEEDARFFIGSVRILAAYHKSSALSEIVKDGNVIAAVSGKSGKIVPAELDYVSWTDQIAEFAQRNLDHPPTILLSGKCSPLAARTFAELRWKVLQNYTAGK